MDDARDSDRRGGAGHDPRRSRAARAEDVFLKHLEDRQVSRGAQAGFETLCREHPELEDDLRLLRSGMAALERVRGRLALDERARDPALRHLLAELKRGVPLDARFELGDTIGSGGQGEVREALERVLGRAVAIKALRGDVVERSAAEGGSGADQVLARFLAEAQITAQLDHPGVVAVHELAVDESGRPYFTMTRVRGRDLREVFEARRAGSPDWPLVRCLSVLLRVCETMSFAHARGVVHRDLKPANVMVGSFGEVYVMDWGLARAAGASTSAADPTVRTVRAPSAAVSLLETLPSQNLGTVFYMAPEVAEHGAADAGPTIDVYAVGAILYELLSGRPPYWTAEPGATHDEVLARIRSAPPEGLAGRAPGSPPELVSIAERALARRPQERYPDMAALERDLRAFLENRVVRAHASGPIVELRKWVARNRRLAGALAAGLLAVLGGLAGVAAVEARARRALDLQADLYRLPYLEAEAQKLWPETPARIPAYERWLATAQTLVARTDVHRDELASLREGASAGASPDADGRAGPRTFADPADELRHDTLAETVARLEAFADPQTGLLAEVRARLAWARDVERRTLVEPAAAWERAAASVAAEGSVYGALELSPILGLVPLGPDPRSGLEELAVARSGRVPERGGDRRLRLDGASAIVLVLVPGGSSHLGAQPLDPARAGFDAGARPEERPVLELTLAPFLIAKHELTRGQWERLGGTLGELELERPTDDPDRHPVAGVSWNECVELLRRFGLTLPTEAQWEHAARAGTAGPFLGSDDPRSLAGSVNLADRTVVDAGLGWPQARGMEWLSDGYVRHAPVGSYAANVFGLHDVLGNVWEWCLDGGGPYRTPLDLESGLRLDDLSPERVARGGGYVNNAAFARVTIRDVRSRDFDSGYHGVRPAMGL